MAIKNNIVNVKALIEFLTLELKIKVINVPDIDEVEITDINNSNPRSLNWVKHKDFNIKTVKSAILIVPYGTGDINNTNRCLAISENPRLTMTKVMSYFFSEKRSPKI